MVLGRSLVVVVLTLLVLNGNSFDDIANYVMNIAREAMAIIGLQSGETIAIKSSKTWKDQAEEFFKHLDDTDLENLKKLASVGTKRWIAEEQETCEDEESEKIADSDLLHFQEASKKHLEKIVKKQKQS